MATVTFDFDSTLSRKDVQEYASMLIERGADVWILTSRYDDNHKNRYPENPCNDDLYTVAEKLGIPRHKIRFQNMRSKSEYLHMANIVWHLDDDDVEIESIFQETKVIPINVNWNLWKHFCEKHYIMATLE